LSSRLKSKEFWTAVSPLVGLVIPLCTVVLLGAAFASHDIQRLLITSMFNIIFVVGFYVFAGNSGILSFGHIGFAAIGGYVVGLLTVPVAMKAVLLPNLPHVIADVRMATIPAMIIGLVAVAVFAAIVGYPIVRLKGVAPAIAFLAMLEVIHQVISNWRSVTGGESAFVGMPIDSTLMAVMWWTVIVIVVAYLYQISRSGRRVRGSREDYEAARSVGVRVTLERYKALILSAAIMGLGGGLYGHYLGSLAPTILYLSLGFLGIEMLIVGGFNSLSGAVTGAVVISVVSDLLRRGGDAAFSGGVPGLQEVVLAVLVVVVLVRMPRGLTGGREANLLALSRLWRRPRRSTTTEATQQADVNDGRKSTPL
jgi:branched-chain amino acid transport system permease protein